MSKGAVHEIAERRLAFAAAFVVIFVLVFVFLKSAGLTPEPLAQKPTNNVATGTTSTINSNTPEAPTRIIIDNAGVDATISNPNSTDIKVLDEKLNSGAVRWPASAMLGTEGTVLLFGHSSYLPVVHNQAYKTFDDIQKLKPGQIISVYSATARYDYAVTGVRVADANQDSIELFPTGKHLVLVTCDSFASKSNRFIVSAEFEGAYALQ